MRPGHVAHLVGEAVRAKEVAEARVQRAQPGGIEHGARRVERRLGPVEAASGAVGHLV